MQALSCTHRHLPSFPHRNAQPHGVHNRTEGRILLLFNLSSEMVPFPNQHFSTTLRTSHKGLPSTARTVHPTPPPAFTGFIRAQTPHCSRFSRRLREQSASGRRRALPEGKKAPSGCGREAPTASPGHPRLLLGRRRFATGSQRRRSCRPDRCGHGNNGRGCPAGSRLGGRAGSGLASLWRVLTGR